MRVSQIYIFHTTFHHSLAPLPLTAGHRQRDAPRASSPRRTLRSPSSRAESALALATAQSSVTHAERYGVSGCFLLHHTSSVTRNTPEELYTLQRDEANATPVTASRPGTEAVCACRVVLERGWWRPERRYESNLGHSTAWSAGYATAWSGGSPRA